MNNTSTTTSTGAGIFGLFAVAIWLAWKQTITKGV